MKQGTVIENNIFETMKGALGNTLNFENCSSFEEYDYEKEGSKLGSALGLCYENNYILKTLVPYLKEKTPVQTFTEEQQELYAGKPMKLSMDVYGVIDYWWIILAVNGYANPIDFRSFNTLLIPSKSDIASILDKESFSNEKIGKIPESTDR